MDGRLRGKVVFFPLSAGKEPEEILGEIYEIIFGRGILCTVEVGNEVRRSARDCSGNAEGIVAESPTPTPANGM
jgi:hypothetical protein